MCTQHGGTLVPLCKMTNPIYMREKNLPLVSALVSLKSLSIKFVVVGLSPEDRKEALEELFVFGKDNQLLFFKRMAVLAVVATVIATGGLLSDSVVV